MNEQNYEYQLQALEEFRRFLMEFVEELTTEMSQYRGQADNLRESGLTIQLTNNYLENYQYRIMQSLGRVVDNILKIHIPFINKNIEAVERAMGAARRVNSLETGFSHNIFKENMKTNWGFEAPTNINSNIVNMRTDLPTNNSKIGESFESMTKTPEAILPLSGDLLLADGGNKPLDSAQESVNPKTDTYGYDLLASEKNDPFINSLINFPQGHINQGTNFLHTTKTSEVMPPPIGSNLLGDGVSKPLINLDKVKIIGRVQLNDGSFIEILNNGWHVHYVDAEGSDKIVSIKDKTGKHIPLSTFNPGITPSHIKGYKEFPDTNWNLVREKKNFFKELYLSGAYVSNYSDGRASNSLMNFPQSPINQGTDFLPRTKTPKIMLYDYNPLADGGNDPFINSSINFPQSPINQGTDSLPVAKTPEIMPPSVESNLLAGGVSKPIVTDSLPIAKTPEIMPPSVESNLLAGGVSKPIVTDLKGPLL